MNSTRVNLNSPASYLKEFNSAAFWAGVTAFIFMVFGALTVQISVLGQFPISAAEQTSWITITWLTASLVTLPLCIYYRQPLAIGWTIPGLVYMGSLSEDFTFRELTGASLVAGVLVLLIGVSGFSSRVLRLVPMPVLMGMFSASILEYEVRLVNAIVDDGFIVVPMVVAYGAGLLLGHRKVPPVALAVLAGAIFVGLSGRLAPLDIESTTPTLLVPGFEFSFDAILSVSLPMVVLVLGVGNVQSLGFMMSEGYRPPLNLMTSLVGLMSMVNAVFGGHSAAMARTVTAIVAGQSAGELGTRYWAAAVAFIGALSVALSTGMVVAFIGIVPAAFILGMAGLAILGSFQDAMRRAFSSTLPAWPDHCVRGHAGDLRGGRHPRGLLGAAPGHRRVLPARARELEPLLALRLDKRVTRPAFLCRDCPWTPAATPPALPAPCPATSARRDSSPASLPMP